MKDIDFDFDSLRISVCENVSLNQKIKIEIESDGHFLFDGQSMKTSCICPKLKSIHVGNTEIKAMDHFVLPKTKPKNGDFLYNNNGNLEWRNPFEHYHNVITSNR